MPILLALLLVVTGCSGMVRKSEVRQVQKASIVSLFANERVPRCEAARDAATAEWDEKTRQDVAESALRIFTAELSKLGWNMSDPDQILLTDEYRYALPRFTSQEKFFTPKGMLPVFLDGAGARTQLQTMAEKLKVDAVFVVRLDYCYAGIPGSRTGEPVMQGLPHVTAIDRRGETIVDMSLKRERSPASEPVLSGLKSDQFRKLFVDASQRTADRVASRIREAMLD